MSFANGVVGDVQTTAINETKSGKGQMLHCGDVCKHYIISKVYAIVLFDGRLPK